MFLDGLLLRSLFPVLGFDPITLGISAALGVGGGLANLLSKKKSESYDYGGSKPIGGIHELPGGNDYINLIKSRAGGQNVGIPEEFYTRATSPVIQTRMSNYNQYERPAAEAEFSSRGINYSPLVGDIMSRRRGDLENSIQQYLGETALQSELLKRQEQAQAIQDWEQLLNTDASLANQKANFERGIYDNQWTGRNASFQAEPNIGSALSSALLTGSNAYSALTMPDLTSLLLETQKPSSAVDLYSTKPIQRSVFNKNFYNPYGV